MIEALFYTSGEKILTAENAYNSIKLLAFDRVSGFYQRWGETGCALVDYPVSQSVSKNPKAGELNYTFSYTNNPSQKSGISYSYERSLEENEKGYLSLSQNGQIKSLVNNITGAYNYWMQIKPGIEGEVQSFYNRNSGYFNPCSGGVVKAIETEETFRDYYGEINYNYSFSDDPSYYSTGDYKRISVTISDNKPVHKYNYYPVFNYREVVESARQSTEGSYSVNVEIQGRNPLPLSTYISEAASRVVPPDAPLYFISDTSYSFNENKNNFNYSVNYWYSKYRGTDSNIT